jgi:hypothetical protein
MAMTWGTRSSPIAQTIYPGRLEEGLQVAAENFCRTQVSVTGPSVELPALLSWYRTDFGKSPSAVFRHIRCYLADDQQQAARTYQQNGALKIIFCADSPEQWCFELSKQRINRSPGTSGKKTSAQPKTPPKEASPPRAIVPADSIADMSLYTSLEQPSKAKKDAHAAIPDIEFCNNVMPTLEPKHHDKAFDQEKNRPREIALYPCTAALATRQESLGDSLLLIPGRKMEFPMQSTSAADSQHSASTVATKNTAGVETFENDANHCGHPHLRQNVSAMTFGSEFNLMMHGNAIHQTHRKTTATPLYTL